MGGCKWVKNCFLCDRVGKWYLTALMRKKMMYYVSIYFSCCCCFILQKYLDQFISPDQKFSFLFCWRTNTLLALHFQNHNTHHFDFHLLYVKNHIGQIYIWEYAHIHDYIYYNDASVDHSMMSVGVLYVYCLFLHLRAVKTLEVCMLLRVGWK